MWPATVSFRVFPAHAPTARSNLLERDSHVRHRRRGLAAQHRPDPGAGPAAARIPRLRLLRRACSVASPRRPRPRRARSTARVAELLEQVDDEHLEGSTGIAHTRWATHGAPAVHNAHPHFSHGPGVWDARGAAPGSVALVHNGIIENHDELRAALKASGYVFASQTDTEVIAHLIDSLYDGDLFEAVKAARAAAARRLRHRGVLQGRAAPRGRRARRLAADPGRGRGRQRTLPGQRRDGAGRRDRPDRLPGRRRRGRPAAGQVLDRRPRHTGPRGRARRCGPCGAHSGAAELGPYRHYMQKEIFEQPRAIADTLEGVQAIVPELFGDSALPTCSRRSTRC